MIKKKKKKRCRKIRKKSSREEKEAERKRLEFPVNDTQKKEADANIVGEEAHQAIAVPKRARFSESEEESSEPTNPLLPTSPKTPRHPKARRHLWPSLPNAWRI